MSVGCACRLRAQGALLALYTYLFFYELLMSLCACTFVCALFRTPPLTQTCCSEAVCVLERTLALRLQGEDIVFSGDIFVQWATAIASQGSFDRCSVALEICNMLSHVISLSLEPLGLSIAMSLPLFQSVLYRALALAMRI